MSRLPALTPDTAHGAAKDMLADLVVRNGQVGTMVRTMATYARARRKPPTESGHEVAPTRRCPFRGEG